MLTLKWCAATRELSARAMHSLFVGVLGLFAFLEALAQEDMSAEQIARELANPNTALGILSFNTDYISYTGDAPGAGSEESWRLSFQPIIPYPLAEGVNLFVRPLIPLVYEQPVPLVSGGDVAAQDSDFDGSDVELGDIGFDVAIGKTFDSGLVLIGGMVGTLDTATDDDIGLGQTLLGPEAVIGFGGKLGFIGALVSHQWDVAGDDDFDTSITSGQYFYTINLKDGWQIQSQPTYSYNHEAPPGEESWTFPLGVGLSKTTRFGKTPWKFRLEYWHYVEQADSLGPDYQVRFTFQPVVPLPW